MSEQTAFSGVLLRRFFKLFGDVKLHGAPVAKYLYYPFWYYASNRWPLPWAKEHLPGLRDQIANFNWAEVYRWADEPYPYDPHPEGVVLMRAGFGDIASLYLPKERFMLLSPNQAEVDLIHRNRPDLTAHNIEKFYREDPAAVNLLNQQISSIINNQKDDPLMGSADLQQWFGSKIPEVVRVFGAFHELFTTYNVSAALSISSIVWMDSALNLIARANRVASLTLQHGLILERDLFCHIPIIATQKVVWGSAVVDWYQKHGYPPSRMIATGSPRFDAIFKRKWCTKQELCQKLTIDPAKKIIVYATGTEMNTIVPIIVNGLKTIPDVYLVMLLHPSESRLVPQYQQLAAGYENCQVLPYGSVSLYDALSGGDYFITHTSTAGLEAMLFQVPVITVEPEPACFSYGDLKASLRATNAAALNRIVKRLLTDANFATKAVKRYQNFLAAYCVPDALASKRLFDRLDQLCATGGIA